MAENLFLPLFLLSESHCSIHTYPENNSLFTDLFTCGDVCDYSFYHTEMVNYLKPKSVTSDLIIRDDCPNLFDIVPETKIGIFNEGSVIPERAFQLRQASELYKMKIPKDWKGEYYNTGVMVLSRRHKKLFFPVKPEEFESHFYEQSLLNLRIIQF